MRRLITLSCLLLSFAATAQTKDPKNYMLVSAVGSEFTVVMQKETVGSNLPPYRKIELGKAGEAINRIVLADLDQQIAAKVPDSQRALMIHPGDVSKRNHPSERADANLKAVLDELRGHPDRSTWDRIVVVTPAFKGAAKSKMAAGLYGIGIFINPLCSSNVFSCEDNSTPADGTKAQLPDGSTKRVNTYYAPYFYITVWEVDAASLKVLEKKEVYENKRMASADGNFAFEPGKDNQEAARQVVSVMESSIKSALRQVGGKVEVRVVK